jgi:hypothetical protein
MLLLAVLSPTQAEWDGVDGCIFEGPGNVWCVPFADVTDDTVRAASADYIADIRCNTSNATTGVSEAADNAACNAGSWRGLTLQQTGFAPTIWEATGSDPVATVYVDMRNGYEIDTDCLASQVTSPGSVGCIASPTETVNGRSYDSTWAKCKFRIPTAATEPSGTDGHTVVIGSGNRYEHDMYKAVKDPGGASDNSHWEADIYRVWDTQTDDGVVDDYSSSYPEDLCGKIRACPMPLTQGLIYRSEIDAGFIPHALAFGYRGEDKNSHTNPYPCKASTAGSSYRTDAMWVGYRLRLHADTNCDDASLALGDDAKTVCQALIDYGAFFIDSSGTGYNPIYFESNQGPSGSATWSGTDFGNIKDLLQQTNASNAAGPYSSGGPHWEVVEVFYAPEPATQTCQNGVQEGTEDCDQSDLGGQTCLGLGFDGGTLSCNADCTFSLSGCTVSQVLSRTQGVKKAGSKKQ